VNRKSPAPRKTLASVKQWFDLHIKPSSFLLLTLGLAFVLFFAGNAAHFYNLNFIDRLSINLYDYSLRLTMPRTQDARIVILDIDEESLKEEGRWPWSRDRLAALIDTLFDKYQVAIVGFDVVFAEKDESSGLKVLQQIGNEPQFKNDARFQAALVEHTPQLEYDKLFASKLQNRKVTLGYYLANKKSLSTGKLPEPTFPRGTFKKWPISFTSWQGYSANLPELQKSANNAGHFNPLIDFDGKVRRVPMLVEHAGAYYESLSLAMVRTLLGNPKIQPGFGDADVGGYAGLEWLELEANGSKLKIPVDYEVAAFVPYRGDQGSFTYISVSDVLHERVELSKLKNKIVLMGTSAPGLMDMRATPVGEVYPGVEVQANMISGILNQTLKYQPAYMKGAETCWILLVGIILIFVLRKSTSVKIISLSLLMIFITISISLVAWQFGNVFVPTANALVMIAMLFALNISYGYFITKRIKRQIVGLFGKYVPIELVNEMVQNSEQVVSMNGEDREMSILFSDVRGFTSISEGMNPKELSQLMNEFLTPLSRVVNKHNGKVDKYMGDCIMAFWGAPMPDKHHARNAICAGLEMQAVIKSLQSHFKERGWPEIFIGVGINTGHVSVGNMGSDVRIAYTVMGDEVNLASRLEGATKQYGVDIIVGENTRNAVPDFIYRELDYVRLRGKTKPVAIFEPICLIAEASPRLQDEIYLFHEARSLYLKQDWDQAELHFMTLKHQSPTTKLYEVYIDRIAHFRKNPPPAAGWDGVFVFQTK
jgi:adenylate cyclase